MMPSTVARVPEHTPDRSNEAIHRQIRENVLATPPPAPGPSSVAWRNWIGSGTSNGPWRPMLPASPCWAWGWGRSWTAGFYLLPAAVAGFLLQHALQGWCPPVPLFRSLDVRTASEIAEERYALKILRGDFRDGADGDAPAHVDRVFQAVRH